MLKRIERRRTATDAPLVRTGLQPGERGNRQRRHSPGIGGRAVELPIAKLRQAHITGQIALGNCVPAGEIRPLQPIAQLHMLFNLVLGAVAKALHGVPADAALHDVAVQVVLETQVLVDGEPVGGHLFAFVAGAAAAEVSTTVGVEQVACGVEREGFQVPARGRRSAGSIFLGGEDAAQGVVTVLAVAAQAVARGDEVACGVVLVQAGDALAGGQGSVPVPEGLG